MKEKITLRFLTENYYNKIYRKLLRSLSYDQSTAEDITQDVFLELCKKWGTYSVRLLEKPKETVRKLQG